MTYASRHRHDEPSIKGLYAEARRLSDIVLRRLGGIGCEVNEKSLPKAQAIVGANIGELVAAPEYATLLDRPGGESRILALLVQSCAAEITAKTKPVAQKHRRPQTRHGDSLRCQAELLKVPRGTPLRRVVDNGNLSAG